MRFALCNLKCRNCIELIIAACALHADCRCAYVFVIAINGRIVTAQLLTIHDYGYSRCLRAASIWCRIGILIIQQNGWGNLFALDRHRHTIRGGIAGSVVALDLIPDIIRARIGFPGNRSRVGTCLRRGVYHTTINRSTRCHKRLRGTVVGQAVRLRGILQRSSCRLDRKGFTAADSVVAAFNVSDRDSSVSTYLHVVAIAHRVLAGRDHGVAILDHNVRLLCVAVVLEGITG